MESELSGELCAMILESLSARGDHAFLRDCTSVALIFEQPHPHLIQYDEGAKKAPPFIINRTPHAGVPSRLQSGSLFSHDKMIADDTVIIGAVHSPGAARPPARTDPLGRGHPLVLIGQVR